MKLAFQLAYKNLVGAGLRTWLNVIILSFSFIIIIFFNGIYEGWNQQAMRDTLAWEYGQGQLRHQDYDQYDAFSIQDAHGAFPDYKSKYLTPILYVQGSLYPHGRMVSTLIKGIDNSAGTLEIPTEAFQDSDAEIPAIIGSREAKSLDLKLGDEVLLRWRDQGGTFDAQNITIVSIFENDVPSVDKGQIWIPIQKLWTMTGYDQHATVLVAGPDYEQKAESEWTFLTTKQLTQNITDIIASKKVSSYILFIVLLSIALLALFDTQVLSIFRRQREIGTYIALGMTRRQVVGLFTVEGTMYSLFATILAAIYGTPLLMYMYKNGFALPQASADSGLAVTDVIYPIYPIALIAGTVALVVIAATIVSYLPSSKIARLDPVDALKGKIQ